MNTEKKRFANLLSLLGPVGTRVASLAFRPGQSVPPVTRRTARVRVLAGCAKSNTISFRIMARLYRCPVMSLRYVQEGVNNPV
jgi:hypothetical protein